MNVPRPRSVVEVDEDLIRLRELVDLALDQPDESRATWINSSRDVPDALRDRLRRFISAEDFAAVVSFGLGDTPEIGSIEDAPRELPVDTPVSRWRLQGRVSVTPQAEVYQATSIGTSLKVVVKLLRVVVDTATGRRRSRVESEALARLDHPGVVRILDAGVAAGGAADGRVYIVMELVDGLTFDRWVTRTAPTATEIAWAIADAADAVHHANLRGVVHRDLKPSNLMMRRDGRIAVIDFGVARLLEQDGEPLSASLRSLDFGAVGTLSTMAPEQFDHDRTSVDLRADVYALGVIAYQAISGRLPVPIEDLSIDQIARRKCETTPHPLRRIPELRVSKELSNVIAVALDPLPAHRYQSCAELADDLRRAIRRQPTRRRPPGRIRRAWLFVRRNAVLTTLAAACTIAVFLGVAGVVNQRNEAMAQRAIAERQLATTLRLTRTLVKDVVTWVEPRDAAEVVREGAISYYSNFLDLVAKSIPPDPRQWTPVDVALALETASARLKLVMMLGYPTGDDAVRLQRVREHVDKAVVLCESLLTHAPDDPIVHQLLARGYLFRRFADGHGYAPNADIGHRSVTMLLERAVELDPSEPGALRALARALAMEAVDASRRSSQTERRTTDVLLRRAHEAAARATALSACSDSMRVAAEIHRWQIEAERRSTDGVLPSDVQIEVADRMRAAHATGWADHNYLLWMLTLEAGAARSLIHEGHVESAMDLASRALAECRSLHDLAPETHRSFRILQQMVMDTADTFREAGAQLLLAGESEAARATLESARTLLEEALALSEVLIGRGWADVQETDHIPRIEADLDEIDRLLAVDEARDLPADARSRREHP